MANLRLIFIGCFFLIVSLVFMRRISTVATATIMVIAGIVLLIGIVLPKRQESLDL